MSFLHLSMLLPMIIDIQRSILKAAGRIGAVRLAVLAAYPAIWMLTVDMSNTKLKCNGESYQSYVPLQQLLSEKVVSSKRGLGRWQESWQYTYIEWHSSCVSLLTHDVGPWTQGAGKIHSCGQHSGYTEKSPIEIAIHSSYCGTSFS